MSAGEKVTLLVQHPDNLLSNTGRNWKILRVDRRKKLMTFKVTDSLTEQIARHLGKQIIQGEMPAGERIQELRIAAELNVSRGSVREALLLLERRHLVDIFPRRGAMVAALDIKSIEQFFDFWFLLIEKTVISFCQSWENEELAPFFDISTALVEAQQRDDLQAYYDNIITLLVALYSLGRNSYLEQTLMDLLPLTQRCFYAVLQSGRTEMDNTNRFVEQLLQAVIARNEEQAKSAIVGFAVAYKLIAQDAVQGAGS